MIQLRPLAAGSHTASATSAAAVDTACPVGTRFVEVGVSQDFHYKRAASATTANQWGAAGGPYLIPMECPSAAGVFSVISVAAVATKVHVTPMGD